MKPPRDARRRTILVVDDEKAFRALILRTLERAGYETLSAADGDEGRELLQRRPVDLVVTDWNMPRMDGGQLTRWIRKQSKLSRLPILMLTVRGQEQHETEGFECGADEYLTKPFSPLELGARIASLLSR